jgi:hypothetical protein
LLYLNVRRQPTTAGTVAVQGAQVAVAPAVGHCPRAAYVFTGTILTDGKAGDITYEWIRPDGGTTAAQSASLPANVRQGTVRLQFSFQGSGSASGDAKLRVLTPVDLTSAPAHIEYLCP